MGERYASWTRNADTHFCAIMLAFDFPENNAWWVREKRIEEKSEEGKIEKGWERMETQKLKMNKKTFC